MSNGFTIPGNGTTQATCGQPARAEWLDDVVAQFRAIANLPADWNSHGAAEPNLEVLDAALACLHSLCAVQNLPRPHVNPTPSGGVQLEWDRGACYFEIEFLSNNDASCLFRDDEHHLEEVSTVSLVELPRVISKYGAFFELDRVSTDN